MSVPSVFVWEYDTRPEAPVMSPAIQHLVRPEETDATLCDLFIDTEFSLERPDEEQARESCEVCWSIRTQRVLDQARSDVARELGVDESEVF